MSPNRKTGLLGHPLSHSVSPMLHALLGDDSYRLFDVPSEDLDAFLRSDSWDSVNVTIPYKKAVLRFCNSVSERAEKCNSANILVRKDGKILADNSDYAGFCDLARGIDFQGKKICILGSGGVSATVCAASLDLGAREIVTVSRTGEVRYEDTPKYCDADILIQATPVGMYPAVDACPVDLTLFTKLSAVLDLIANPLRTTLVLNAEKLGIPARGGFRMLCTQAWEARRVFTREEPSLSHDELYRAALDKTENIVLIGMPGSGKSTFGKFLAEQLNLPFSDTDELIEAQTGLSIPQIFEQFGEAYFRALEEKTVEKVAAKQGLVLATGGGAPLSEKNRMLLKHNSTVIHLSCPTEELSREGRPLSASFERLVQMQAERADAYADARDLLFEFSKSDPNAKNKLLTFIQTHREEL